MNGHMNHVLLGEGIIGEITLEHSTDSYALPLLNLYRTEESYIKHSLLLFPRRALFICFKLTRSAAAHRWMCHVILIFLYNFIKQLASCCFTTERHYRSEAISTHMLSLPCGKPHFSPAVNSEWRQTCQLFHMRDSRDQLLSSRRPCCPRFLLWLGRRFPNPVENSLWKMTSKKKLKRKRNHRKEVRKLPEGSRFIWLED